MFDNSVNIFKIYKLIYRVLSNITWDNKIMVQYYI